MSGSRLGKNPPQPQTQEERAVLLRETLDQVIAADGLGLWDQQSWFRRTDCGTAGCFAGWRFMLDGGEKADVNSVGGGFGTLPGVRGIISVPRWSQERMGLTEDEADMLFSPLNSLPALKQMVDELCDGKELSCNGD